MEEELDKVEEGQLEWKKVLEDFYGPFSESLENIANIVSNDHMTWINISGLQNTKLIADMGKAFDVSSLFLEDILNTDQRPRFSEESDHLYIIAKSFYFG